MQLSVLNEGMDRRLASVFISLLLFSSFFFYLASPILYADWWPFKSLSMPEYLTALVGSHVGLSYYFYMDKKSYPVINKHKARFFLAVPAVFVINYFIFCVTDQSERLYFHLAMMPWNWWHFQRQHYGVFCFIKQHFGLRATPFERNVIMLSCFSAIAMQINALVILLGTEQQKAFYSVFAKPLTFLSGLIILCTFSLAVKYVIDDLKSEKRQAFGGRILPILFFIFLSCNYLPYFFMPTGKAMFMTSSGHGLQYIVFMIFVAIQRNRTDDVSLLQYESGNPIRQNIKVVLHAVWGILLLFFTGYFLYQVSIRFGGLKIFGPGMEFLQPGLASITPSIVIAHFVQDAAMWRLSRPEARNYVQAYYWFIFPALRKEKAA